MMLMIMMGTRERDEDEDEYVTECSSGASSAILGVNACLAALWLSAFKPPPIYAGCLPPREISFNCNAICIGIRCHSIKQPTLVELQSQR